MTELFGELRSVLSSGPIPAAWETLKRHLSHIHPDAMTQVMPWARHHLEDWPDHLRVVRIEPYHPLPTLDDRWFEMLALGAPIPAFRLVRRLLLTHGAPETADALAPVMRHPDLEGLTILELPKLDLGEERCVALTRSPHLAHLHTLDLSSNRLTGRAVEALARASSASALRHLNLSENWLSDGLDAMAKGSGLPRLESLDLTSCLHGASGSLARVLSRDHLPGLQDLSLKRCAWDDDALSTMLAAPPPSNLSGLALGGNHLTGVGIAKLMRSPWSRRLRALDLGGESPNSNTLDPDLLDVVCARGDFDTLEVLKLDGCLEDTGRLLRALASRRHLQLSTLSLGAHNLSDVCLSQFLTSPSSRHIQELRLGSPRASPPGALTDATLDALARVTLPTRLRQLVLQGHFTESCGPSLRQLMRANPDLGVLLSTPHAQRLRGLEDLPIERLMILD